MERNLGLEIAKVLHNPVDPNVPLAPALAAIVDFDTAMADEDVYKYTSEDTNATDRIYTITGCTVTAVAVTPQTPALVSFTGLQSALEYICLDEIVGSKDDKVLGRRKAAIARAMNKKELKETLALILGVASQEVLQGVGEDVYDVILKMRQKISDFGEDYVLLVGSGVFEKIEGYKKVNATNFNYDVDLMGDLLKNITVMKIVGSFTVDGGAPELVLDSDKAILVARQSSIAEGRPLSYVRREIMPEQVQAFGGTVEGSAQRLIVPVGFANINVGGDIKAAYGIYAYEKRAAVLKNYRAVSWATIA